MQSKRAHEKLGRDRLQRIIDTCKSVEEKSLDPFLVDIDGNIDTVKKYFSEWKDPQDLCMDAETLNRLATMVELQSEWVKHRSTSLYTDPFLLEEKIKRMSKEEIARTFLRAWRPTVEWEQISLHSLTEAFAYWNDLLPLAERWKETDPEQTGMGSASVEELIRQRILRDKAFSEELEDYWRELKTLVAEKGKGGKIEYWDYIGADSYERTVDKAFMASFLITYGYATLEIHPLEEETFLVPFEKPALPAGKRQLVSVPIAVSTHEWERWKQGELR